MVLIIAFRGRKKLMLSQLQNVCARTLIVVIQSYSDKIYVKLSWKFFQFWWITRGGGRWLVLLVRKRVKDFSLEFPHDRYISRCLISFALSNTNVTFNCCISLWIQLRYVVSTSLVFFQVFLHHSLFQTQLASQKFFQCSNLSCKLPFYRGIHDKLTLTHPVL